MKKITIAVILFLLVGAFMIIKQNNFDIKEDSEDRVSFTKKFTGWLLNVGKNIKDLTGQATQKEWLPQENYDNDTIK